MSILIGCKYLFEDVIETRFVKDQLLCDCNIDKKDSFCSSCGINLLKSEFKLKDFGDGFCSSLSNLSENIGIDIINIIDKNTKDNWLYMGKIFKDAPTNDVEPFFHLLISDMNVPDIVNSLNNCKLDSSDITLYKFVYNFE